MNLLILRLSSMGDVIHTLPALEALRTTFPEACIGWVVENSHAGILYGNPSIDRLYILPRERMRSSWRSLIGLGREMKQRLREVRWDTAIDFQGLWKSRMVAHWSGARRILGYAPSQERTHLLYTDRVSLPTMDRHAVDRNLDLVGALGAGFLQADTHQILHRRFPLPIAPGNRLKAESLLDEIRGNENAPLILLNFSARKPANRWGVRRFAALSQRLREAGFFPVLTGGPGDGKEEKAIQSLSASPVPSLVGRCSLMELAAVMEQADVLVTGDTGPMHVAVAVGLPVVALFGPANPVRTGPYDPNAVVLQKPRDCQPCYARHCKFGEEPPPCLLEITVEEVVEQVKEVLNRHVSDRSEINH